MLVIARGAKKREPQVEVVFGIAALTEKWVQSQHFVCESGGKDGGYTDKLDWNSFVSAEMRGALQEL